MRTKTASARGCSMRAGTGRLIVAFLFLALLLSLAGWGEEIPSGSPPTAPTVWETGTYWTYDAILSFQGGSVYRFPITLIVLGGDTRFDLESWDLAGIYESYGGSKIVGVLPVIGPAVAYLRWPVILNFIPGSTISSMSDLTGHPQLHPGIDHILHVRSDAPSRGDLPLSRRPSGPDREGRGIHGRS